MVSTFQFRLRTDSFSTVPLERIIPLLPASKKATLTYNNYRHTIAPLRQLAIGSPEKIFLILIKISNINFCF